MIKGKQKGQEGRVKENSGKVKENSIKIRKIVKILLKIIYSTIKRNELTNQPSSGLKLIVEQ